MFLLFSFKKENDSLVQNLFHVSLFVFSFIGYFLLFGILFSKPTNVLGGMHRPPPPILPTLPYHRTSRSPPPPPPVDHLHPTLVDTSTKRRRYHGWLRHGHRAALTCWHTICPIIGCLCPCRQPPTARRQHFNLLRQRRGGSRADPLCWPRRPGPLIPRLARRVERPFTLHWLPSCRL